MAGKKTHEQQIRIIEKRENTSKSDHDFKAEEELQALETGTGSASWRRQASR